MFSHRVGLVREESGQDFRILADPKVSACFSYDKMGCHHYHHHYGEISSESITKKATGLAYITCDTYGRVMRRPLH